jgi:hypothetical protein
MKIDIRLEDGKPILFFLNIDVNSKNNLINCFNHKEMHNQASRAYMRSLKKPLTKNELLESFRLLKYYANEFIKYN